MVKKKIILPVRISKILKNIKIHQNVQKNPRRTAKMNKIHHEYPKYPKTLENDQNAPKTTTIPTETFKTTKITLNPQNKQSTLETFENDLNIPKLSQNTLDFLDFEGILVDFKLPCSFERILWYFTHFSNIEVYILIILDFWGILAVYEAFRFD